MDKQLNFFALPEPEKQEKISGEVNPPSVETKGNFLYLKIPLDAQPIIIPTKKGNRKNAYLSKIGGFGGKEYSINGNTFKVSLAIYKQTE